MDAEKFRQSVLENSSFDYGICPPPTKAQDGLNILIDHFLGEDWYVTLPINKEQVNTEAIYEILRQFPRKKILIYPKWRCQDCGEPIGYLGRFIESIFGKCHKCNNYIK